MNDAFELAAPEEARAFLRTFDSAARRKGEKYFQQSRVTQLTSAEEGAMIGANVQGGELYNVDLDYVPGMGWSGECSCPMEFNCKHVYAVMHAALAEHSVTSVRQLSSSQGQKGFHIVGTRETKNKNSSPSERVFSEDFGQKATSALGRPLRPEETAFLRKLDQIYRRCCQSRRISCWDFDELGLSVGGYGWDALQIWPSFPQTQEEFWLYVANAAIEHRRKIPEFLLPVTDLGLIQDRLHRWRRGREIEQWKRTLSAQPLIGTAATTPVEVDLRLVLRETRPSCSGSGRAGRFLKTSNRRRRDGSKTT